MHAAKQTELRLRCRRFISGDLKIGILFGQNAPSTDIHDRFHRLDGLRSGYSYLANVRAAIARIRLYGRIAHCQLLGHAISVHALLGAAV